MALGGGTFITQNKILPGSYINFISASKASATLSDRGYGAMALCLDWGVDDAVFTVTNADFQKNSLKIFGYDYTSDKLKGLRDLFLNLQTLYAFRLNSGVKASCVLGTAKYSGVRGNDLKINILANADYGDMFDVCVLLDSVLVDKQTVSASDELIDNDFVVWKKDFVLTEQLGIAFTNGANGVVSGASHQTFLDKVESFTFNTIGCVSTENTIKQLYSNFTKRMRDEVGAKFQLVVSNYEADYEGVVNVKNICKNADFSDAGLVYWVTGVLGGCAVNKSCLNKKYDGEFEIGAEYTQAELISSIKNGEFVLHNVSGDLRVLADVNSLVTVSDTKGDDFKQNQTVRVMDQIANDIAVLFNTRYLGVVPNDKAGRVSLWADIVKHHEQLEEIRAIEDFLDEDVVVTQGDTKNSVVVSDSVCVVNAMAKLYMTVVVE